MSEITDLDALIPEKRVIKYEKEEISVPPPKTGDLLRLGTLAQKMAEVESLDDVELNKAVLDLTSQVYKMIPALDGKTLNLAQLQALIQILSEMAVPKDIEALNKRGITLDKGSKAK